MESRYINGEHGIALKKVLECAYQLHWPISIGENKALLSFDIDDKIQKIIITPVGKSANGDSILEFLTQGLPVSKNEGICWNIPILYFLERNGMLQFGHWGLKEKNGVTYMCLIYCLVGNTLEINLFKSVIVHMMDELKGVFKKIISS